jgi:hypothetical protein
MCQIVQLLYFVLIKLISTPFPTEATVSQAILLNL